MHMFPNRKSTPEGVLLLNVDSRISIEIIPRQQCRLCCSDNARFWCSDSIAVHSAARKLGSLYAAGKEIPDR